MARYQDCWGLESKPLGKNLSDEEKLQSSLDVSLLLNKPPDLNSFGRLVIQPSATHVAKNMRYVHSLLLTTYYVDYVFNKELVLANWQQYSHWTR